MPQQHVDVDLRDAEKLVDDLETFARKAIPFAVRNSLNASAFEGRKLWKSEVERSFVLRNRYVANSLRVEKARGLKPDRMEAVLGSVFEGLATQEKGGVVRGSGGRSKPIPTTTAAGQAMTAPVRTKVVRRANWLRKIRAARARNARGLSKAQQNAAAVRAAAKAGGRNRFALLNVHGKPGLYRVTGRKRLTVRMVWSLAKTSVRIPRTPTLQRTLDQLEPKLPRIHVEALRDQARRHKILGY